MVVILTQDLMMSSSAGAVARANSVTLKTVASAAKAIEWLREQMFKFEQRSEELAA